jgi:monofunctional biosynthetic peptidoglycan transglycosylase
MVIRALQRSLSFETDQGIADKVQLRGASHPRGSWVRIRELPAYVVQAVVTAEDSRFVEHWGVDLLAFGDVLSRSNGGHGAKRNVRLRGASTITMQTVKNLFLWPGRSYIRKGLELVMAPIAGLIWGKRRTLELYLNVIEWGDGVYGIDAAAWSYFNKRAAKLTLREAAALAAILPNPRRLSPLVMAKATRRRFERIMRESYATKVP